MELLVGRPAGAHGELLHTVAGEAGVRVAVDKAGDRALPASVDLEQVAVQRWQVTHPPHGCDPPVLAEDVCLIDDLDAAELGATQRRARSRRRGQLGEIADEQPVRGRPGGHSSPSAGEWPGMGTVSPCSAATSRASS